MSADSRRFKVGLFHRRETVSPCDQNRTKLCGTWLKPGLFRESAGIPAGFHDPYFTFILHANIGSWEALSRSDAGSADVAPR